MATLPIYTIGHGNRTAEEYLAILLEAGIARLADVRAHPGSRRHPQFSQSALTSALAAAGVRYAWEGSALGGRRRGRPDSRHTAWRNASFRAYADHMESTEFVKAMETLMDTAAREPTAIMCAERLPWQCHRYLIADFLVMRGVEVLHLMGSGGVRAHALNSIARVEENRLVYDRNDQQELGLQP